MPSNIPPNWSWVKLGDVCEFSQGIQVEIKKQSDKKLLSYVRFLRIIDFTQGKEEPRYVENPGEKYFVRKDDLSMVRYGAVGFICRGIEGVIANNLFRIIPDKILDKGFIFYFFKAPYFQNELNLNVKGATMPAISFAFVKSLIIPLPPLPEQKKIVEKIEELFSGLDSGVASLQKAKEQLRIYRQSVLAYAFNGKLTGDCQIDEKTGLPQNWELVKLVEVADIINGYAFKSGNFKNEGKYQVIKIGNVRPGNLRLEERPAFIDDVEESILNRSLLKKNDLIISLTGTRKKRDYGYVAMVANENNLLLNQRLAIIRLQKKCNSKFFLYLLRMDLFLDQFFRNETGNVGQGNVGINGVRESMIQVPLLAKQIQIVEEIEKRFSEADNLEKAIDESLAKAETLRQSILKQAFEGKLV